MDAKYSIDPRARWDCSRELDVSLEATPNGWIGAPNAWLLYMGPSYGNSDGTRSDEVGEACSGVHPHIATFNDRVGFWNRLRDWTIGAFRNAGVFAESDGRAPLGVIMMANVIRDECAGTASKIAESSLQEAMPQVLADLKQVMPRLIVPLERRVYRLLVDAMTRSGAKSRSEGEEVVPVKGRQRFYRPRWCILEAEWGAVQVARIPQHPSRGNFIDAQQAIGYLSGRICASLDI